RGIAVSPDSRTVYVAAKDVGVIRSYQTTFDLAEDKLKLTGAGLVRQGVGGVDGLTGVHHLAVSSDGKHLYAISDGDDALTAFAITPDGSMPFVQAVKNGIGVTNMVDPAAIALSPDGLHVYVAAHGSSRVHVFSRNAATGAVTPLASFP